jgi:phosphomannomutase|tara:strand:+ start:82 stop:879 length:798 start_codon:yes stop_codon:yes gene_type:complete
MKSIVLFDMDGTLTPPREKVNVHVIKALKDLSEHTHIGIVTGSGYDYLVQQCQDLWSASGSVDPSRLILLPCNGTQVYKWSSSSLEYEKSHSASMIEELGRDDYNAILSSCIEYQSCIFAIHSLPYTGTFFHYRESMLNWCPIGRSASTEQRLAWVNADRDYKIRHRFYKLLMRDIEKCNIQATVALGGSTSFDIYPSGWDKTYALRHFPEVECWFVGDKCTGDGNDRAIYEALLPQHRAFITTSPEETIAIVSKIVENMGREGK